MVDLQLSAQRGHFRLQLACRLTAPWTVVFGPSGSGKTTLLRLIAGLESPNSGHISLDGRTLTDRAAYIHIPPGSRHTGLVAQHPALFPHLSVAANVAYGLAPLPLAQQNSRVATMLDLVGASPLASRSPRDLSGGEAQRIALARALAPQPRLLLLDDPLSARHAEARDHLLDRLKSWLADQKMLAILVTHDAADALATHAEVAILNEGQLSAQGPANSVLHQERTRLQARLSPSSQ